MSTNEKNSISLDNLASAVASKAKKTTKVAKLDNETMDQYLDRLYVEKTPEINQAFAPIADKLGSIEEKLSKYDKSWFVAATYDGLKKRAYADPNSALVQCQKRINTLLAQMDSTRVVAKGLTVEKLPQGHELKKALFEADKMQRDMLKKTLEIASVDAEAAGMTFGLTAQEAYAILEDALQLSEKSSKK